MARTGQKTRSRSLATYALLLKLYAPEFLARHRAEMLQNFEDLENTLSSKTGLWLFIGKDLMFSLVSRNIPKSLWGQTALMFIVLGIVLAVLRALTSQHYFMGAVTVCYGFVIGWFAGWMARRRPARIHHCMRSIGLSELLIELMMVRSAERSAFGRPIIQYDTVQRWIAESRVELEQARLLAYRCAWRLDQTGHHGASSSIRTSSSTKNWRDVSLVKVAVPAKLRRIADRAMQVFGAMGGSDDTPIHQALAWWRLLRIGDGPDEVHRRQIFKMETMPSWGIANSPYLAAHPA